MNEENLIIEEKEQEEKKQKKPPYLLFGAGIIILFVVVYGLLSFLDGGSTNNSNLPQNKDIKAQLEYQKRQQKREKSKIKAIEDKPYVQKKERKTINIDAMLENLKRKRQESIFESEQPKHKDNETLLKEILKSQEETPEVNRDIYEVSGDTSSKLKVDYKIKKDEYEQEKQTMFAYSKTYKKAAYYAGPDDSMIKKPEKKRAERFTSSNPESAYLESFTQPTIKKREKAPQEEYKTTTLIYNSNPPVTVFQGEWIDCVLLNRIEASTTESPVIAVVYRDFYDDSGEYVVIPSGTRIVGKSLAINYMGAERLFITFNRMILPNGQSVRFPYSKKTLQALDTLGANGLVSDINRHYLLQFGAAIFLGVLDGFAAAAQNNYDPYSSGSYVIDRTTRNFEKILGVIMQRYSNIMPTITVEQGEKMKVYLSDDLLISPYSKIEARHYVRN